MTTQLDTALAAAALSERERRVIERFVASLREELGSDLSAVWLYGSRARGERTHPDSDVDLLVIAEGDVYDQQWLRGRREIESFFIGEVDRDKIVLAGSGL